MNLYSVVKLWSGKNLPVIAYTLMILNVITTPPPGNVLWPLIVIETGLTSELWTAVLDKASCSPTLHSCVCVRFPIRPEEIVVAINGNTKLPLLPRSLAQPMIVSKMDYFLPSKLETRMTMDRKCCYS